jgi:hypothetical protein
MRALGVLVVAAALVVLPAAARADVADVVEGLFRGFASEKCEERWAALSQHTDRRIGRVMRYREPAPQVTASLQERARTAPPSVQARVRDATSFTDEYMTAFHRVERAMRSIDLSGSDDDKWKRSLVPVKKILEDRAEPFIPRLIAAALIAKTARTSEPARKLGWDRPVPALLTSPDPTGKLVSHIVAAGGNLTDKQQVTKDRAVTELIRGLDADTFAARYQSQEGLRTLARPAAVACVETGDDRPARASGIQAWQAWAREHRARLSRERID